MIQTRYPELTNYINAHAHGETLHHANGIVGATERIQQDIVEYWIQQILGNTQNTQQHPDVLIINPADQRITREHCESLLSWVYTKPQYSPYRIVHIAGAHRLNSAAANSLLKLIEEPPNYTVIFLSTHALTAIPATIRSRVQWFWAPATEYSQQKNDLRQFWVHWLNQPVAERDMLIQESFFQNQKTKETLHQLPEHLTTLQGLFRDMIFVSATGSSQSLPTADAHELLQFAQRHTLQQLTNDCTMLVGLERMCREQVSKKNIIDYLIVAL